MAKAKKKDDPYVRCFEVCEPQLHPKGFTIYKVIQKTIKVDAPEEDVKEIVVWRRYNDFKKLYKAMSYLHKALHRKEEFPPFAAAKMFGRFDSTVIKERQQSAQDLLNFVGQKHYLVKSKAFREFFEGGETVVVNPHGDPILEPLKFDGAVGQTESDALSITSSDISGVDDQWLSTSLPDEEVSKSPSVLPEPLEPDLLLPSPPAQTPDTEILPRVDTEPELGGVWQFRQTGEEDIGSLDDEENAAEEDGSSKDVITSFDPFAPMGSKQNPETDDAWLLSALSQLKPGGKMSSHSSSASLDGLELQLPLPPTDDLTSDTDNQSDARTSSDDHQSVDGASSLDQNGGEEATGGSVGDGLDSLNSPTGKVQCGHGDMPFNILETPTTPTQSDLPPSDLKPTVSPEHKPKSSKKSPKKSSTHSPGPSPSKAALYLDLEQKGQYIIEAAKMISLAQQCEANGNYHMAFNYYKDGVGSLISGVQGDDNTQRRDVVRRKTAKYLMKAEDIYNKHLAPKGPNDNRWDTGPGGEVKMCGLSPNVACLQGPVIDLGHFRVLGVINKVLLVYDSLSQATYVMKILHKSVSAGNQKQTIVPLHSPFMVQLVKFYESDNCIFLVLQHASGGTLWSYISAYLHQQSDSIMSTVTNDIKDQSNSNVGTKTLSNVYSGHHYMPSDENQQGDAFVIADKSKVDKVVGSKADGPTSLTRSSDATTKSAIDSQDLSRALQDSSVNFDSFCDTNCVNDSKSVYDINNQGGFNELLKETSPAIEYFSINSFDSDSDRPSTSRYNSTTSDNIESIPEVNEIVGDEQDNSASNVFTDSHQNMQTPQLHKSTSDSDDPTEEVLVVTTGPHPSVSLQPHGKKPASDFNATSTPIKGNAILNKSDTDSIDEPSIYDLHKPAENDAISTDDSLSKFSDHHNVSKDEISEYEPKEITWTGSLPQKGHSQSWSATELRPQVFRMSSQERSLPGMPEGRIRQRTLSGAFAGLDLAGNDGEEGQHRSAPFHLPEGCVRQWIAEIVVALANLHAFGIICRDLRPDNILLGERGHILLSYFSQWTCVDNEINAQAIRNLYVAPEVTKVGDVFAACDWWSLGVIMFELLTGMTLISCCPGGVNSHTAIIIPDHVSPEAQRLLQELLRYNPHERLGSGVNGFEDVRMHPFFNGVNWASLLTYTEEN